MTTILKLVRNNHCVHPYQEDVQPSRHHFSLHEIRQLSVPSGCGLREGVAPFDPLTLPNANQSLGKIQ